MHGKKPSLNELSKLLQFHNMNFNQLLKKCVSESAFSLCQWALHWLLGKDVEGNNFKMSPHKLIVI